ncbi:MAG: CpsD/CapB family tyrosine-protein kinase [Herpetosiphonaceae bacterium]|nr:CpsD/CapB family tyrosine-protein kinase [Herpetosiphonaceae bacterium]
MPNASDLVTIREPRSAAAEAYRALRTNIQFASLDKPLRTLLATSTAPNEGKSTTLANLAVTIAQGEQRVILVDCDLRRPTLHTIFNLPNEQGLTTMMLREDAGLLAQKTDIPGLVVLPSGPTPPRPADILGSKRMKEIILKLREYADMVLFDTPPINAVTDAAVLATAVDGVLLVFRAGDTKRDRAREAHQLLDKVNANVVGVVLTNVKGDQAQYSYYGT